MTRPGEVLEATPGLIVTQHSGDGKANQYFLRGYNLDHGTDLAIYVDDVPVNMRTHAHGQGYADLNWLMPETVNSLEIRKGPYFADEGDFSSVGNLHIGLIDSVPKAIAQVTAGSFGYRADLRHGFGEGRRRQSAGRGRSRAPMTAPGSIRTGCASSTACCATRRAPRSTASPSPAWPIPTNGIRPTRSRSAPFRMIGLFGSEDPSDGGNTNRFALSARIAGTR